MSEGVGKKPREFWIENYIVSHSEKPHESAMYRYVHVIEYSAFEQLEKEKAEFIEALEYIGKPTIGLLETFEPEIRNRILHARQVLSKLGGGK